MLANLTLAESLKAWRTDQSCKSVVATHKLSQGIFDVSLYAAVLLLALFKATGTMVKGSSQFDVNWTVLFDRLLLHSATCNYSDISLHLVTEL